MKKTIPLAAQDTERLQMTILVDAIYRYPIKGFSPQLLDKAQVSKGKALPWDRAFAIENGPSKFDPEAPAHLPKIHFLMLMKQPELASLKTEFDPETGAFGMTKDGETVASGNLFDPASMSETFAYLSKFCTKPLRDTPRLLHAKDHAFTDSRTHDLTLINLTSVKEISEKAGAELDPLRFRGNIYVEGATPWQEHDWVGGQIQIGDVTFTVRKRTVRCAATNANPDTGERDQDIPKLLMDTYDHADCGIHLMPENDGLISTSDPLIIK